MAIKSLQTIKRLENLATTTDIEKVVLADFRSPEEIMQYVKSVNKMVDAFNKKIESLKELFTKLSIKNRVSRTVWKRRKKVTAGKNYQEFDSSEIDLDNYQKVVDNLKKNIDPKNLNKKGFIPKSKIQKIDMKISPMDMKRLHDKTLEISALYQQIEKLESIAASLDASKYEYEIKDRSLNVNSIKREVKATSKKTQDAINKAEAFLSGVARKTVPPYFSKTVEAIVNNILDHYSDYDGEYTENLYMTTIESSPQGAKTKTYDIKFVHYLNIELDVEGEKDEAFLVFTGIVDIENQQMTMYVSFYNSFVSPDKIEVNQRNLIKDKDDGTAKSIAMLSTNLYESELETVPLPQTPKKLLEALKKHPWIGNVTNLEVKDENIIAQLNKKTKIADIRLIERDMKKDIAVLLYSLLGSGNRPTIKSKVNMGNKTIIFYMGIPQNAKEDRLNADLVEKLRELFPFSEDQVRKIVRLVNY